MVNVHKLELTPKVASDLFEMAKDSKKAKKALAISSREMQMVSMYLELATIRGKDRFNASEIAELMNMIKDYNSEIPADDMVKQLLDIGKEKDRPLSIQEMKDFFQATPLLDKEGQVRVLEFMKTLKDKVSFKYDAEYIKSNKTFEKFKNEYAKIFPELYKGMSEEELKKVYQSGISKELKSIQYKAYTCQFDIEAPNVSNFINLKTLAFVYGVANCDNPAILAEIVSKTGITSSLSEIPNELVKVYEISDGNVGLVQDIVRCFLSKEILQIVPKLADKKYDKDLSKYCQMTRPTDDGVLPAYSSHLINLRRSILMNLNLQNQVNLCHLKKTKSVSKIADGDFERGKRQ